MWLEMGEGGYKDWAKVHGGEKIDELNIGGLGMYL